MDITLVKRIVYSPVVWIYDSTGEGITDWEQ